MQVEDDDDWDLDEMLGIEADIEREQRGRVPEDEENPLNDDSNGQDMQVSAQPGAQSTRLAVDAPPSIRNLAQQRGNGDNAGASNRTQQRVVEHLVRNLGVPPSMNHLTQQRGSAGASNRTHQHVIEHLVRNLALLGPEDTAAAAESTIELVLEVCTKVRLSEEGRQTVALALRHWLARCDGRLPGDTIAAIFTRLNEFDSSLNAPDGNNGQDTRLHESNSSVSAPHGNIGRDSRLNGFDSSLNAPDSNDSQDTAFAVHACRELWARRRRNCVLHFKEERFWSTASSLDDCSCLLQNVDPCRMDAVCLLQIVKLLWSTPAKEQLRKFVKRNYEKERAGGLRDDEAFDKKWDDTDPQQCFEPDLSQHLRVELEAHPFVRTTIPKIMGQGCGMLSYDKQDRELLFRLDAPPTSFDPREEEEFALDYATGEVTSSKGRGVLHALYEDVRELIRDEGSTTSMSRLVANKGLGNVMKFDAKENSWRIYDKGSGIWRLPDSDCEPHSLVSHFACGIFQPVERLAVFLGEKFNWVTGSFEEDDDDDCNNNNSVTEDDSASICTVGSSSTRKRKRGTMTPGQASIRKLAAAKCKYVESLKHQNEVLKAGQHLLIGSFSDAKPYQLPCINGIVDLRTGGLRPIQPDDLVTRVCQTPYDPAADVGPARAFYESFLPLEAYPDQQQLVAFLSEWMGYSISGETNLEMCVYFYGIGSNSKTTQVKLNMQVLGEEICQTVPMECLCKKKGENNDALHDAMRARLVMISESDDSLKIHESAFRSLVSGEKTKSKTMYKREVDVEPRMKVAMYVNNVPKFENGSAFYTTRRNAYFPLKKIFVDEKLQTDRREADHYRAMKMPECLIGKKDRLFFEKHVLGHEASFLRFWVEGAVQYYNNGQRIDIPKSLQEQTSRQLFDTDSAVDEFVDDRLEYCPHKRVLVSCLYEEFVHMFPGEVDVVTFNDKKFGTILTKTIAAKATAGTGWGCMKKRNGSVRGGKGMYWENLALKMPRNAGRP